MEAAVDSIDSSGRDLSLTIDDFKARWTVNDILCSVVLSANGSASLQFQDPATGKQHFFFFFFSGSDYKAFNGKRLDNIKDKIFSKPHDVPTETTEYGVR